jgi:hypothetical protein
MKALAATTPQLLAAISRAKGKGGPGQPILIHADPDSVPETRIEAEDVTVLGSRSPLEIRSLLARPANGTLVILTDCDYHELGDELVGRIAGQRIWPLDRWETIKDLFAAQRVSAELARKPALADALIEATPLRGYRPVRSGVVDVETAVAALLREYLKIPEDIAALPGLFRWAMREDAPHLLAGIGQSIATDIEGMLEGRFGVGASVVLAILRKGLVEDLVPLALAGTVIHDSHAGQADGPRARLDSLLGSEVPSEAWVSAGQAASDLATADDAEHLIFWTRRANDLLGELKADHLAHLSDLIPSGFEQRMQHTAEALSAWASQPTSDEQGARSAQQIRKARQHRSAVPERTERLEMAARLLRRGTAPLSWGHRLADAARTYRTDGAWLDYCRTALARGDSNDNLKRLYADLVARADALRAAANEEFAVRIGKTIGSALPADVIGVENILEDVVAPIAAEHRVLLVVLDGMGWPSFIDVHRTVSNEGWVWWARRGGSDTRPALAVLPTVTEFSRTSLFAGTVRQGGAGSEQRAFGTHKGLVRVSKPNKPPVLFHKRDVRDGIAASNEEIAKAIGDPEQQVVAVVLNNIDERLKDVSLPIGGWGFDELTPLRELLAAAEASDRLVIFTADHGHILDQGAQQVSIAGGGERWKPSDQRPEAGEIEVSGPRVIGGKDPGGSVILPYVEQRHYGTRRNGYHGGLTPQEVFVPLVVLSRSDLSDAWDAQSFSPPVWWHHRPRVEPAAPTVEPRKHATTPTLFDDVEQPSGSTWLDRVLEELEPRWTPAIRLTRDEARVLLDVLDEHGSGAVSYPRLAEMTGLAAPRIQGYVAQLRQLVNIDGYGVIEAPGQEVRFDRALLERQLGLR